MHPDRDVARYVHMADDYDAVRAAWDRLGFPRVSGWGRGDGVRSTLYRAGPTFVELVDGASTTREPARPPYAAAVAMSGR